MTDEFLFECSISTWPLAVDRKLHDGRRLTNPDNPPPAAIFSVRHFRRYWHLVTLDVGPVSRDECDYRVASRHAPAGGA